MCFFSLQLLFFGITLQPTIKQKTKKQKIMKKLFLMAVVMLASVASYAQHATGSFTLQPKVGLNIASLTKCDGADPRFGVAAGVEAEYQASDIFSISFGAMYSMQGNKYDKTIAGRTITATNKIDYINIPVLANVYVVKGLAVKVGIQPGFKVNDQVKLSGLGESQTQDVDKAESFDFSIPIGLSYEFSNVVLDARYNFGCTKVFDGSDPKNSVFQITLGYKFDL